MHKYLPHTNDDIKQMLDVIGVDSLDSLLDAIPKDLRMQTKYLLENPKSEYEVLLEMGNLAKKNARPIVFRGYGAYDHITPSIILPLITRQEFLTSYTPYQPEVSQGTLHYIFEYQSMICELTQMEVSNASMYDGATASAEAIMMAYEPSKGPVLMSHTVHPHIKKVIETYAHFKKIPLIYIPEKEGVMDRDALKEHEKFSALFVQNPNHYGIIESFDHISEWVHEKQALFIMNMDAATLSHLKTPGEWGADIACGESQSLGIPLSIGGAYIGYLATKQKFIRKMPGRICGLTTDADGKDGFVLTFQAREQHIRRAKANSNICSNQSLNALFVTIYLAVMGKKGLYEASQKSIDQAHYLYQRLIDTKKFTPAFKQPFFKEFALKTTLDIDKFNQFLLEKGFLGPIKVDDFAIFAVTEKRTKEEMDTFVSYVEAFI